MKTAFEDYSLHDVLSLSTWLYTVGHFIFVAQSACLKGVKLNTDVIFPVVFFFSFGDLKSLAKNILCSWPFYCYDFKQFWALSATIRKKTCTEIFSVFVSWSLLLFAIKRNLRSVQSNILELRKSLSDVLAGMLVIVTKGIYVSIYLIIWI